MPPYLPGHRLPQLPPAFLLRLSQEARRARQQAVAPRVHTQDVFLPGGGDPAAFGPAACTARLPMRLHHLPRLPPPAAMPAVLGHLRGLHSEVAPRWREAPGAGSE